MLRSGSGDKGDKPEYAEATNGACQVSGGTSFLPAIEGYPAGRDLEIVGEEGKTHGLYFIHEGEFEYVRPRGQDS